MSISTPRTKPAVGSPSRSPFEDEVYEWVVEWMNANNRGEKVHRNVRPRWLSSPHSNHRLELDVFIPDLRIAFEVNGVSYHDPALSPRTAHRDEYKAYTCQHQGISLMVIWSNQMYTLDGKVKVQKRISAALKASCKGKAIRKPERKPPPVSRIVTKQKRIKVPGPVTPSQGLKPQKQKQRYQLTDYDRKRITSEYNQVKNLKHQAKRAAFLKHRLEVG